MKRILCIIFIAILSIPMSGCWSRHEPRTLALISSAIYDLSDDGGYLVTAEIINPAADSGASSDGSGKNPSITAVGRGNSFPEGIRKISESVERTVFGGHIKVRFFSERFARKDISSIIDYLLRDTLTDENPLMVVIKDDEPDKIYTCIIGLSDTVGEFLDNMSDPQFDSTSQSIFIKTLDFVKDYYEEGKQPVAGVVTLVECDSKPSKNTDTGMKNNTDSESSGEGSEKKYRIVYGGLAAFKGDKLVGYLDEMETRAYNFITNNIELAPVTLSPENNQSAVIVYSSKAKNTVEMKGGQASVNLEVTARMYLAQENYPVDISRPDARIAIEEAFNKQVAEEITKTINKAQTEFRSDIFGFGVSMHRKHPKDWDKVKDFWDDCFTKANINVSVDSSIDRSGELEQPFKLGTTS